MRENESFNFVLLFYIHKRSQNMSAFLFQRNARYRYQDNKEKNIILFKLQLKQAKQKNTFESNDIIEYFKQNYIPNS